MHYLYFLNLPPLSPAPCIYTTVVYLGALQLQKQKGANQPVRVYPPSIQTLKNSHNKVIPKLFTAVLVVKLYSCFSHFCLWKKERNHYFKSEESQRALSAPQLATPILIKNVPNMEQQNHLQLITVFWSNFDAPSITIISEIYPFPSVHTIKSLSQLPVYLQLHLSYLHF